MEARNLEEVNCEGLSDRRQQVNQGDQTRLFNYDSLSRLLSATSPESGDSENGATFYTYDKASNLVQRTDPRGEVTSYTYD